MNGITYFRLNSQYEGDITKNCALTGSEVDNNFYTLEGRDIRSVELIDGKVVVNLMNGEKLTTENITENCIKELDITFDEITGTLKVTQNGVTTEIGGFVTNYTTGAEMSVDGSLVGSGLPNKPIGISPVAKTGQYRPVNYIIDIAGGEKLPNKCKLIPGDRFLTIEEVNEYGYLYNYEGLKKIACKLKETCSEWRIPTKEDWDDMLNAIEPRDEFKNHDVNGGNKNLGKFAGKFLKSVDFWKADEHEQCCHCNENNEEVCIDYSEEPQTDDCTCANHDNPCHPNYCGEWGDCHYRCDKNNSGIDKYGFRALPAGYANEAKDYLYFGERAYFWSATNQECRDAYIKVLAYNKSNVLQDIFATDNYLSVRLVKTYNGDNFKEREEILGSNYSTVLMPSVSHGQSIWTSVNISIAECNCDCHCKYVLPNDGENMEFTKKYFTNEWTGKEWFRKEVADGESVVVINEVVKDEESGEITYNPRYVEYRVVNGELVDVSQIAMGEMEERVNQLSDELQAEIERSTGKDNEHDEKITIIENNFETINNNIQTLNDGLAQEIARSTERDGEHDEKLQELDGKMLTEDGTLFDKNTGILTLKSKDGTNDIDVQFDFNFGTF